MKIIQKGRFLYFDDVTEQDIKKLKKLLNRDYNKTGEYYQNRKVKMLFYDEEKQQYYTYFGYLKYIQQRFGNRNVIVVKDRITPKIFDRSKFSKVGKYTLRPYQVRVVEECLLRKYGTVVLSTGAGKSLIIMSLVKYLNKPSLIINPTKQLVEQMYKKMIESGVWTENDIGLLYGNVKEVKDITIGTFQTVKNYIENYPEKMERFKIIFFDEAATTFQSETGLKIDKFYLDKAEYAIGLTATPYRYENIDKSPEDFVMLGLTGNPIAEINTMYLVNQGYLTKPYIYFETIKAFSAPIKNWHTVYRNYVENFEERNLKIVKWADKFYRNKLKSLILVNTKKHATNLFELLPDDLKEEAIIIYGNNQGMVWKYGKLNYTYIDYNKVLEKFENGIDYKLIIATQVMNQGTDLPSLSALILAFGGKSMVSLFQRMGRTLRIAPNKSKVFIIDFFDDTHGYLKAQSINRIKLYKKERLPVITDKIMFEKMIEEEKELQEV